MLASAGPLSSLPRKRGREERGRVAIGPMAAIVPPILRAKTARCPGAARFYCGLGGTMFITPAYAQLPFGLGGGDSAGMITSFMPLILIIVIMYFLVLRPQQQKVKLHQAMIKALRRGDTVITNGGLLAKVTKVVDDDQIEVEIADGVRVRQMRSMVTEVRAKSEPVKDDSAS